jgi:hypothetical protein
LDNMDITIDSVKDHLTWVKIVSNFD